MVDVDFEARPRVKMKEGSFHLAMHDEAKDKYMPKVKMNPI